MRYKYNTTYTNITRDISCIFNNQFAFQNKVIIHAPDKKKSVNHILSANFTQILQAAFSTSNLNHITASFVADFFE